MFGATALTEKGFIKLAFKVSKAKDISESILDFTFNFRSNLGRFAKMTFDYKEVSFNNKTIINYDIINGLVSSLHRFNLSCEASAEDVKDLISSRKAELTVESLFQSGIMSNGLLLCSDGVRDSFTKELLYSCESLLYFFQIYPIDIEFFAHSPTSVRVAKNSAIHTKLLTYRGQ